MGNKQSRDDDCGEPVECISEVPRVAKECDDVGTFLVDKTIDNSIKDVLGPQNAAKYTDMLQQITSGKSSAAWDEIQPDTVSGLPISDNKSDSNAGTSGFTNYEGFKEGASNKNECVECSCVEAADKIIARCKNFKQSFPSVATNIITSGDSLLPKDLNNSLNPKPDPKPKCDKWSTFYAPGIELGSTLNTGSRPILLGFSNKEPFNNKEPFDNNGTSVYKFIQDAIQARHDKFKDTASFIQDCRNSSYYSMKKFITDEKMMLDKLHNYYSTFATNYESLYLHKETISKIINNKLDELEKIQGKIDSYKTNLHVDNRKNNYQNNNYEFYISVNKYMLILYYSLFIVYLIFSNFFSDKQYTNKKLLVLLLIYLIIPIILSYTINITYEGYIYFLEYNNLKEDTQSYVDIIKKK